MKNCFAFVFFAAATLTATWVFAQATDPQSYRQALLARPLPAAGTNFCQQVGGSSQDCQVTVNFLLDLRDNRDPSDHICPAGASIQYAGNPANADKITKHCI
jgi:hypothetical protein